MKKHISEELPARKFKPSAESPSPEKNTGSGKENKSGTDKVRQAVYDIRYRARREEVPLQTAFSQYMANSSMGQEERTAVRAKLFGESFEIEDFASSSVARALFEVFANNAEENLSEDELLDYFREEQILNSKGERKYKVEVVGNDGRSYVRYATREKINDLRLNPNIKSVEMTDKGVPYEGEKTQGKLTAAVKSGKDWDGDGKVESGSKEHAGVVHNAIQRKKGGVPDGQDTRKESVEYINEIMDSEDDKNKENEENETNGSKRKKIDVLKGKKNNVEICPTEKDIMNSYVPYGTIFTESDLTSGQIKFYKMLQEKAVSQNQQQLAGMALAYLRGEMPNASEEVKKMAKMGEKKLRDFAKTKHKGLPEKVEEAKCETSDKEDEDTRGEYAEKNVIKNRIRAALGVKNPIIISASNEMGGELVDEAIKGLRPASERTKRTITAAQRKKQEEKRKEEENLEHKATLALAGMKKTAKPGAVTKTKSKPEAPEANRKLKSGKKVDTLAVKANKVISSSYEPEGEVIDELRRSEKEGKGSPDTSREPVTREMRRERGRKGGRHQYSGSVEFGGSERERGVKKNDPDSQHQRLNPPEEKGRQLKRGSAAARQRWHSARD